jgi:hypothetical protein
MKSFAIAAVSLFLLSAACSKDKSGSGEPASAEVVEPGTPEGDSTKTAGDSEVAEAVPVEKPAAAKTGMPTSWKEYRNEKAGYRIMGPAKPPKATDFGGADAEAPGMVVSGEEFMFEDCFGQVIVLEYTGKEAFDVEKGMDGGIEKMLSNVNGTVKESTKNAEEGRPARQYSVDGNWKGTKISGLGRGVAVSGTKILVVNAFWQATDASCPAMGDEFVKSFAPISK